MSWSTASVDWWGSRDSNPDAFRHMILNHARLPIPTLPPVDQTRFGAQLPLWAPDC